MLWNPQSIRTEGRAESTGLVDKLRKEYGFKGYVVSDSDAVQYLWSKHRVARDYKDAVRLAVNAGLNVRTEFNPPANYILPLRELVREGAVIEAESEDASVQGVRKLNEMMSRDPRIEATVLQTVGVKKYDGLAIALVK